MRIQLLLQFQARSCNGRKNNEIWQFTLFFLIFHKKKKLNRKKKRKEGKRSFSHDLSLKKLLFMNMRTFKPIDGYVPCDAVKRLKMISVATYRWMQVCRSMVFCLHTRFRTPMQAWACISSVGESQPYYSILEAIYLEQASLKYHEYDIRAMPSGQ